MKRICVYCKKEFKSYPSETRKKFCNRECQKEFTRRSTPCPICGKEIISSPSTIRHKKYCSKECREKDYLIETKCVICANIFKVKKCYVNVKTLNNRCCSDKCKKDFKKLNSINKEYICSGCSRIFFGYRHNKTHLKFCSQDCSKKFMRGEQSPFFSNGATVTSGGYRAILVGEKYILEHRLIMEEHLGRKLERDEHIHHKDGDKLNNKLENLELMSTVEHSRLHHKLRRNNGKSKRKGGSNSSHTD